MNQNITATFEDGVLIPDETLPFAAGTRVHLLVTPCTGAEDEQQNALAELDRLCDEEPIDSGGARRRRDQLHERS